MTIRRWMVALVVAGLSVSVTRAAEHQGLVTFGGLPVPGATVTATRDDTTRVTSTDPAGVYRLDVPDGVWKIRVEMVGFAAVDREVTVAAGTPPASWPLALRPFEEFGRGLPVAVSKPATPAPSVAAPPASAPRDTGARPADAAPRPAATTGDDPPAEGPFGAADGLLINGSVNNGAASPFAQMAAFGNNRRGGRSLYNGGVGVLLGNSAWDARPYSFSGQRSGKPSYGDVQLLSTFGGPIRIPRWFRNGPTAFFGYQRITDHNATTQSANVPTRAERNGDFSQSRDALGRPVHVVNPATGLPFSGNQIPGAQLSPQALSLLKYYPEPNADGGGSYNYQNTLLTATEQDSVQARLSQAVNSRTQLFGNVTFQRTTADATSVFGFTDSTRSSNLDAAINWSRRFGMFFSLRLRYQYTRAATDVTPYFANRTNVSGDAGISGNDQTAANWGPPALTFSSGLAGLSTAPFASSASGTHAWAAEAIRGVGRHSLTFGGSVRPQRVSVHNQQDGRGAFTFTGAASGSDLADFLLGMPQTGAIAFGNAGKSLRATSADLYINDDWRVSPTVTVNAGVRWEYESPFTEGQGRLANLDVAPNFAGISQVTPSDGAGALTGREYGTALLDRDLLGIQPRIGLAWRPIAGSSLVVRGGYGIYRNTGVYQTLALLLAQQPPFSKSFSVQTAPANPLTLANGFNVSTAATSNTFAIDPDFRVGYAHNWQVSAQRDLPASLTIIGTYLGTKGSHLLQEFLPNTYPSGVASPCSSCPSGFAYLTSNGSSLRNAAQLQLRRRLRNGLTASAQYTLAKATDNAAAFVVTAATVQTTSAIGLAGAYIAQDWLDLEAERGPSNFDQRHQLTAQVQYTTGMGITGGALVGGVRGALFRGWTVTGQLTTGSGLPLTPIYVTPVAGTGVTGTVRAGLTGAALDAIPEGHYLNPLAYGAPVNGQWGNAGRNSIAGPAQFSLNGSLGRAFLLRERLNLDWRLDAINLLNRVTYSSVNTIVGSPQFGLANRANTMRKIQTSMRLRF